MVLTESKLAANRLNATKSTGPRTDRGKARSKLNAVAHGLRSDVPVIPGEEPADWEAFRAAVAADLGAVGVLEIEQAWRIAFLLWRQRRVARFEVAALTTPPEPDLCPEAAPRVGWTDPMLLSQRTTELATAERALANGRRQLARLGALAGSADGDRLAGDDALTLLQSAADAAGAARPCEPVTFEAVHSGTFVDPRPDVASAEFLAAVGVPAEWFAAAERWGGWTAGAVRTGFRRLADGAGWTVGRLLAEVGDVDLAWLEGRVPAESALVAVLRYERHLTRELREALDALDRLRAMRPAGRGRRRRAA